jgi:glycolate oxidase FAD binding subunit
MRGSEPNRNEAMTVGGDSTVIVESGGGPGTPEEISEAVRAAAGRRQPLRIVGRGTWPHGGRPVQAHATLDLSSLTGIVEYEPGDLTLTALAGTPLHSLDAATRSYGQWLSLDPFGGRAGSLGATFATASCGPLSASIGLPRDIALGMDLCDGQGTRMRAGGRVVKNVAGFDLVRLNVGAWGTLGVLLGITVRLRPLPEVDRSVVLLPPPGATLADTLRLVRHLPGGVLAAEWLNASLARTLRVADRAAILVRLGGQERAVEAQERHLKALGDVAHVAATSWADMDRHVQGTHVVRWSSAPSELARVLAGVPDDPATMAHANVVRGIARLVFTGQWPAAPRGAHIVVESAPPVAWPPVSMAADDRLSRRLRLAFDPQEILNPGMFGHVGR